MAGAKDFTELVAWRRAYELQELSADIVERARTQQNYLLADQLDDSSHSAPRNIAEGFGRFSHKEFARFVRIALGSEKETRNHLMDARARGYLTDEEFRRADWCARGAIKAASGLHRYLSSTPDPD